MYIPWDRAVEVDFSFLKGKVLTLIRGAEIGSEEIMLQTSDGDEIMLYHSQDCCESVSVEEIHGDIKDLLNSPLLMAEETTSNVEKKYDSMTWTFYRLGTIKGSVTIRWLGVSNGYYSERVSVVRVKKETNDKSE